MLIGKTNLHYACWSTYCTWYSEPGTSIRVLLKVIHYSPFIFRMQGNLLCHGSLKQVPQNMHN